ncbi:hydrolase [Aureococcus anophagefferens]|nr:hydrolase [Aureococcus anophagefferens]
MAPWPTCETGPLEASDADCFALSSARVVLPCDAECLFEVVPATVVVVRGVIAAVFRPGDAVALPGLRATAGRASSAARAAAAGGITCTVDLASQDAPLGAANDLRERRRLCEAAGAHATSRSRAASRAAAATSARRRGLGGGGRRRRRRAPHARVAELPEDDRADLAAPRGVPGGGGGDPLPLLLHAVQLTTEELEASSPFRLLAPGTREDAQSPLMLLPFCQVDDDDDGGGPAAASDAAPPPDDDDWAAPRGPAAATLRAGAAKDRTPTRRAAPPSEFFRSPKNESEGRSSQTIWEVRPFSEEVELERPPPLPPCGSPKQQSPRPFGSPGERSPRSGYDSPPRSQKRDRSDPFGEKEEGTWVKNLLQAELESYQMSGSATTSEPASGPSTARSPAARAAGPGRGAAAAAADGRRMSFLDLDARRASPPEAPLRKPNPRRPPAIKIFKENDRHTRRAIRKEYSLYCDGHPSAAGAIGLEAALDAAASLDDGGGASACGLSLHVAKVSTLQTARVLHDAQAHEDACAAAGNRRLFGDLSGSVALYHLTHCEEAVPHGATVHKVSPPIRHEAHRRALWSALQNGTVAVVTSGHAPGDPRGKLRESGDFLRAAHGTLAGANELLLPVLWSAARTNGYGLGALAVWLSFGPAKLLNLAADRGLIDVGFRADFVIFDADRDWTVDASKLQGVDGDVLDGIPEKKREKRLAAACLFHGHECSGKVLATLLRGRLTYREGRFRTAPHGEVVAR